MKSFMESVNVPVNRWTPDYVILLCVLMVCGISDLSSTCAIRFKVGEVCVLGVERSACT